MNVLIIYKYFTIIINAVGTFRSLILFQQRKSPFKNTAKVLHLATKLQTSITTSKHTPTLEPQVISPNVAQLKVSNTNIRVEYTRLYINCYLII